MDSILDNIKVDVDFTDNNDRLEKLKKSYLILKQKVCRSHDLIKLYNDKLKECERIKIDLDSANKEAKKMTSNYNATLAKVIKLELQNTEYKKHIESLSNTMAAHQIKMAGDKQHLQQLTCKMKELEEKHMDKIMQLDLDKTLLQDKVKELECQLKNSNKNFDSSKRKINKRQQNVKNNANVQLENTTSTADVAVNTVSHTVSTADVAVNTVSHRISTADIAVNTVSRKISTVNVGVNTIDRDMKLNSLVEKSVMTDISCSKDKDELYPLFCNECETILSDPYDKICKAMTKHPHLIEIISSPTKSLHTVSLPTSSIERDENLVDYHVSDEICNFRQSSQNTNVHNNSSNPATISLKPELPLQDHNLIRTKSFVDLATHQPLSNQFNVLPNVVQTPCLINESNNLNNLTAPANSVHIIEKLEEKMKKLEKKIKRQSQKRKQLSTNHLQYFPPMNCYPNEILTHNLSLNMASTFWNEVKNLMNEKKGKRVETQRKRHVSKVGKFSLKKIKLKQRLQQNISMCNNAWDIDSVESSHAQAGTVDNSTADRLKHSYVDTINLTNNDTVLDNYSSDTDVNDKDECCDTIMKENTKNTTLSSTPKETLHVTNTQDEESLEFSFCEEIKDNTSNSMEETNLSDFSDARCSTPTIKTTTQPIDDTSFTIETFDKNYVRNEITDITTTVTTNDSTVISDTSYESETGKETSIPCVDEFSSTKSKAEEMSNIINVSSNVEKSNSINEDKVNNCTTINTNNVTVTIACPVTNITGTTTCPKSSIITTTSTISTHYRIASITANAGNIIRAPKRKLQSNSQMNLLTAKRNSEKVCKIDTTGTCDNENIKDHTSEEITNNKTGIFYDNFTSQKKKRIAHEVRNSNNQEVLTSCDENLNADQVMQNSNVPQSYKEIDSAVICNNFNKTNNYDTSEINASILKEGQVTQAAKVNSSDFTLTNEHKNKCTQKQSNNESVTAEHSTTKMENLDSHTKRKSNKTVNSKLMDHIKHLRSQPPYKVSDLELFNSNEPIIPDNHNDNKNKCVPRINFIKSCSNINGKEECKPQSKSTDTSIQLINETSKQEKSDLYNNTCKSNIEKYYKTDTIMSKEKSCSNINGKEECKPQSKSTDTNIRLINETSKQEKSDLYSNTCKSNIEKYYKTGTIMSKEKSCSNINEKEECKPQAKSTDTSIRLINETSKQEKSDLYSNTCKSNIEKYYKTDTIMSKENSVDKPLHNTKIVIPKNTKNVNNNVCTSSELVTPLMLLENHYKKHMTPKGLRTTKKELKEMADICKATDNFVKKQLNRILNSCDWDMATQNDVIDKFTSTCTARIVAKGIVEFMLERELHNLDKTYTPPAPLLTVAQQRIIALLVDLEVKIPTVIKLVQAGIEHKIFKLNKTPMLHQVQNLVRLYVALTRIQKDREKARMLCCDALYCLGLYAVPVIYCVLTSWPEVFPQFTENTDILPKCMAHILTSLQAVDFPQLISLKNLIAGFYRFKAGNYVTKDLMEQLLNSFEGNCSTVDADCLKTAIILLAKKEGTSWTYTNVIQANLLPNIVNRRYSSMYEAFCLLGHLLRTFPVHDSSSVVGNIIEQLSDLIEAKEGSEDQQEGIISALISLSRHNFEKVANAVMKWTPTKPLRKTTIDQYMGLFKFRTSIHWKGFIERTINKV
ncbi:hypothetical protein KPH14_006229 [Odynerus spinipes]|uniref:Uncharacterized protein n=1 Tax=Odynerus spinipes TaxID=1348599 RepID=A0AAD9RJW0_9HYME|nr:hypothetical protein KPH14_006229 [Odynerus spinipes]